MHPKPRFAELAYSDTPLGIVSLRCRTILSLNNREVYEILLGEEYLMSSLFTAVEEALADLGLAKTREQFPDADSLDVVVGGLGLGFTAQAALADDRLGSLRVVDYLEPVIEWHREGLVPLGPELTADPRCQFVHGDFFQLALADPADTGFDPEDSTKKFHSILLDIDHSPDKLLNEAHGDFYSSEGLQKLTAKLHPGGVFAMWSDDPPEEKFFAALESAFPSCESHVVSFHNPLQGRDSASTIYVAVAK